MSKSVTTILNGTVVEIGSDFASVKLRRRGRKGKPAEIEIRRLQAANVAYKGARFLQTVVDVGAERTITITPAI